MSQAPDKRSGRLIIVDDEPVVLDMLRAVFEGERYEVVCCATGTEAVTALEQGVDVLLTDKNLPDIGGLELIRKARTLQQDVECLVLTGYPSLDTALAAMQLDVFDYIVKPPPDIFDVRRKVERAFEKQAVIRENRSLTAHLKSKNAELEEALEQARELQAELIQSEKLAGIGTLAAGIAHEISSPLFGIMGLAEAIADEDDLETIRGYASDIVEYSQNIKDIVVDLSGYSRTADREFLTTVDLAQVVEDAVRLVVRSLKFAPERASVDVPSGVYLQARTSEIQQVFVNLVKNAVEAVMDRWRGEGGEVRVEAGASENVVWARVHDDGPGIPDDEQAMIFDPFFTTKAPGQGTGLGLNIVYRIVTKYRGSVSVESTEGEGTTFHLRFPLGPDDD